MRVSYWIEIASRSQFRFQTLQNIETDETGIDSRKELVSMKYFFFSGIIGIALSIIIILLTSNFTIYQEYAVRQLSQKGIVVIPDGETHEIAIMRREREAAKLSIIGALLKDDSDDSTLPSLKPGEKAIIEVTVENTGGLAKDVGIDWSPKQPAEGLTLTPGKKIPELEKNSRKAYKITVTAKDNMGAVNISLNLFPVGKGQNLKRNSTFHPFEFTVKDPFLN